MQVRIPKILLSFIIMMQFSCSSIEIFKENTEIAASKPYKSFVIINQEIGLQGFSSQFLDQQVQIHIQEALESRGLVYDKTAPDLVIRYTSNEDLRERTVNNNLNTYPLWGYRVWDPWVYNPYSPYRSNSSSTSSYELVQVIIDFIDPMEDKLLMTLTGVTEVSSEKTKGKIVLKTTDKILSRFLEEIHPIQ
ncbi:MAG: DUF4136 domain-containing protein [Algoriphagus sp.]|nr:DUF4136 domain-containing protein [Algoriphagus sp.]